MESHTLGRRGLAQSYLDPIWILTLPKLDFIIQKDSRRSERQVITFFSCVGSWQHDPAVHQVRRTLEGRKRHGAGGWCLRSEEGSEVKPRSRGPPRSSSIESPPHSAGHVMRPHFAEDAVKAQRGEGTCPRLHTGSRFELGSSGPQI